MTESNSSSTTSGLKALVPFHLGHQPHWETFLKFLGLIGVLLAYFFYMSWKYDAETGFGVAIVSWSFFVLCTPIADGGFILAFPIRLLFGVRMAVTQIVVWFIAIGLNLYFLNFAEKTYELSYITRLLSEILTTPYPYWGILVLSALGTLLSIYFGDEMIDVTKHSDRKKYHKHGFTYRIVAVVALGLLTVVAYYNLISELNVKLPS